MMELVLKVTLLIALGGAVASLLRWSSAAARHFVWVLAISSTLLLPVLAPMAPSVSVTMTRPAPEVAAKPAPAPIAVVPGPGVSVAIELPEATKERWPSLLALMTALWIAGCALLLARIVVGHLGLARIARAALPFGPEWDALIRESIEYTGSRRSVRIAYSSVVGGPLAWGWWRAAVLFPEEAQRWPAERMRAALLHELAHLSRLDHVWQLVAQLACAIYWFHPLVWIAARVMRTESEHACDDRVLEAGMPGPDYAELLLEVARSVHAPRFHTSAAVAMARSSHLEERLHAVLDEDRSRRAVPAGVRAFGAALLALLLLPIAGLGTRVVDAPSFVPPPVEAPAMVVVSPAPAPEPAPEPATGGVLVRELDVDQGEEIRLHLPAGGRARVSGWDEPRVRVEIEGAGADWNDSEIEIARASYGVRVALSGHHDDAKLTIRVPRRFDLKLESSDGGLSISGVEGKFRGNTGGGPLALSGLRGSADLNTGGGDVLVADSKLDGFVNTGGGSVKIVRVQGGLRANTGGGDVHLEEAMQGGHVSTGGGDIRVDRSAGVLEAQTGGGNIMLAGVAGSVRASTGAGDVRVVVVEATEARKIEISSGSGDVSVDLPDDFEGSFDLETEGAHGGGRIESRFPLPITRSGDSVRARGTIGSASNAVVIHTVNGRIDVR